MGNYYIHYTDGTTETRQWCDCCDEERAEYATEQREQYGDWSTVLVTQRLCLACLQEKRSQVGKRGLWGIRFRLLYGNAWNTEGDI